MGGELEEEEEETWGMMKYQNGLVHAVKKLDAILRQFNHCSKRN
jgi:hypothetical protein